MRVKNLILATSAAAALALAAGAAAAEPNGWYGAVDAGWHSVNEIEAAHDAPSAVWNFDADEGWAAFGRLGYRFDQNWRVELEGGYRTNEVAEVTNPGGGLPFGVCAPSTTGPCGVPDGDFDVATLMANVIYDFGSSDWALRPFIGLGAGIARVNTDMIGTLDGNRTVASRPTTRRPSWPRKASWAWPGRSRTGRTWT